MTRSAASTGLRAGLGHDGGDDVADEAHLARGEDRPVQRLGHHRELLQRREAEVVAAGVVDGHHARHRRRLADVDGDQVAVGDRRPDERDVQHARLDEVVDVLPLARQAARDLRGDGPRSRGSNRMQAWRTPLWSTCTLAAPPTGHRGRHVARGATATASGRDRSRGRAGPGARLSRCRTTRRRSRPVPCRSGSIRISISRRRRSSTSSAPSLRLPSRAGSTAS